MTLDELRKLSDDELTEMSCQRNKRTHRYTVDAEKAMKVKRERAGMWDTSTGGHPSFDKSLYTETGKAQGFVKKFK